MSFRVRWRTSLVIHHCGLHLTPGSARMKIKSFLARPYAAVVHNRIRKSASNAVPDQLAILQNLLRTGAKTEFGKDHRFAELNDHKSYSEAVPLRDYEAMKP